MKRHGFSGIHASHGAHKNHRKPGSVGAGTTPSRVLKGKKMPGRMGTDRVTTLNLTLHGVDLEKGLLLIKGAVPGPKGQLVFVRNAVKETD
jgi:large subunit ribosomal protein L3